MVQTMVAVFEQMSHVISIVLPLRPPNTTIPSSTGLEIPTIHQCIDTRDGNYTCTGSMNGEYSQFYTHYTPVHRHKRRELHLHRIHEWWVLLVLHSLHISARTQETGTTRAQDPWTVSILSSAPIIKIREQDSLPLTSRQYRPRRGRESFRGGGGGLIVGDEAGRSPAYFKTVTEVNYKDSNEVRFQSLLPDHGSPPSPLWTDTQNCESITFLRTAYAVGNDNYSQLYTRPDPPVQKQQQEMLQSCYKCWCEFVGHAAHHTVFETCPTSVPYDRYVLVAICYNHYPVCLTWSLLVLHLYLKFSYTLFIIQVQQKWHLGLDRGARM